ncbi:MAG: hypothetical protein HZA17_01820, partial [Nitrospirae bacterium]|nr:hypothetical protein [Nitrospirota bacterium]
SLPADFLVVDLGAGVHFNTLDFFGMADRGIVITVPEPGAVLNAYGFIKGALFRKIEHVFKNHPEICTVMDQEMEEAGGDETLTLDWLSKKVSEISPELIPLIEEIEKSFSPGLVINRVPEAQNHILVNNLISLCQEKLGVAIEPIGSLPDVGAISFYLLNISKFVGTREGRPYFAAVNKIVGRLISGAASPASQQKDIRMEFSDEEIEEMIGFIERLDERIFEGSNKNLWKLRMYFRPADVTNFLISRGVNHERFFTSERRLN